MNDPQIVRFSNENIRPFAELLAQAYYSAKQLTDQFDSKGLATILGLSGDWLTNPNPFSLPTEIVDDGRVNEGVTQLAIGDIGRVYRMAQWIIENAEASDKYMVSQVLKASVRIK